MSPTSRIVTSAQRHGNWIINKQENSRPFPYYSLRAHHLTFQKVSGPLTVTHRPNLIWCSHRVIGIWIYLSGIPVPVKRTESIASNEFSNWGHLKMSSVVPCWGSWCTVQIAFRSSATMGSTLQVDRCATREAVKSSTWSSNCNTMETSGFRLCLHVDGQQRWKNKNKPSLNTSKSKDSQRRIQM